MIDTVLSIFVKEYGDYVLSEEVSELFNSPLARLIIYGCFVVACGSLLQAYRKNQDSAFSKRFFIAWLACLPVGGLPLSYRIVNGLTTSFSYQLEKVTHSILTKVGTNKAMPPGYVYNAIFRASSVDISSPELGGRVRLLLENCVPNIDKDDGIPFNPTDLFTGKLTTTHEGNLDYELNFRSSILENRRFQIGDSSFNCLDFLKETRSNLLAHIREKNLVQMPPGLVMVGTNNGETIASNITPQTVWNPSGSDAAKHVERVALNLAHATAIQKELQKQYFNYDTGVMLSPNNLMAKMNTLDPSVESQVRGSPLGMADVITTTSFAAHSLWSSISKFFHLEGSMQNGALMANINQKMNDYPYFIALIQLGFKIIFPLVCFSLFFTTQVFRIWSYVWLITLITPTYVHFFRSISNSMLLHIHGIIDIAEGLRTVANTEAGFLYNGLNFAAANEFVADTVKLQNTMLNIEMYLWGAAFIALPGGMWVSKRGVEMAGAIGNAISRSLGYKFGDKVLSKETGAKIVQGAGKIGSGLRASSVALGPVAAGITFIGTAAATGAQKLKDLSTPKGRSDT